MIFISIHFWTKIYYIRSNARDNHHKSPKTFLKDLYDVLNDIKAEFFDCQKSYGNTTLGIFFYTQKNKIQFAFRVYLGVEIKTVIGTIPPGGFGGAEPPQVSTPFLPGRGGGGGGGGGGEAKKLLR